MGMRRGADIIMGYGGNGARVIPIRERYGGLYSSTSSALGCARSGRPPCLQRSHHLYAAVISNPQE